MTIATTFSHRPQEIIAQATLASREARFADALGLLRGVEADAFDSRALLLAVRIQLRNNPTECIAHLARHVDSIATKREQIEAFLLLASAQARVGDMRSAHLGFRRVGESLARWDDADPALRDELQYRLAATFWMERNLESADEALRSLLDKATSKFYIESLILDGAIAAARGRFDKQAATLLKALATILSAQPRDVVHWAHVTAQLSYLAREMPSPSLRDAVYENVDAVPWTADIADLHFKTLKAVGWRRALDGDYFSAFRFLKRASQVAPSDAWRVMAMCDRALLAQSLGERRFTEQELDDVSDLASRIEWRAVDGEERIALVLLAVLYAPTDGALALSYIARFQETGNRFDGMLSANDDRRAKAMLAYSLGFVYARLNYKDDALVFLKEAWATFDETGYDWRAARCANEIAILTRDLSWSSRAHEKIARYSRSWMMQEIDATTAAIKADSVPNSEAEDERAQRDALLTPAQREVYYMLMDGASVSDIAKHSSRSEFTVRNHIKAIFKAFNVNSRVALMRAPVRQLVPKR